MVAYLENYSHEKGKKCRDEKGIKKRLIKETEISDETNPNIFISRGTQAAITGKVTPWDGDGK